MMMYDVMISWLYAVRVSPRNDPKVMNWGVPPLRCTFSPSPAGAGDVLGWDVVEERIV